MAEVLIRHVYSALLVLLPTDGAQWFYSCYNQSETCM